MSKARDYDDLAEKVFAPAYPLLARQIAAALDMKSGVCMDIGSGGGHLGFALLDLVSDLTMIFADINPDAVEIALERAGENDMRAKVRGIVCPVDRVPLQDGEVDYIVSRGSLWRWKNHGAAFKELLRLLAPGGAMFIGGGFGSAEIFDQVNTQMMRIKADWMDNVNRKQNDSGSLHFFAEKFEALGAKASVIDDDSGRWILCRKVV